MITVTFRPLARWPYPDTRPRRSSSAFRAGWQDTLDLLERELRHLDGRQVVIGGSWREQDIRQDGMPRSNAREPTHPGVEVSFDGRVGDHRQRLVYATDTCLRWQHNVRSIALGLEALRAVDRYGITRRGEQYAGFKQLEAGTSAPSAERGQRLIVEHGGVRAALLATHPDHGGAARDFADVQAARQGSQ